MTTSAKRNGALVSVFIGAALVAGCSSPTEPALPHIGLPPVDPATVLFMDDFNDENGGEGVYNWIDFRYWDVVAGCVDLHGNGFWAVLEHAGLYVDLDGSCMEAGTIQTKQMFELAPGRYVLEFGLAGNQRNPVVNTVDVSLGEAYEERFDVAWDDPFTQYERTIDVTDPIGARIRFEHHGGDNRGILLDLVRLRRAQ